MTWSPSHAVNLGWSDCWIALCIAFKPGSSGTNMNETWRFVNCIIMLERGWRSYIYYKQPMVQCAHARLIDPIFELLVLFARVVLERYGYRRMVINH